MDITINKGTIYFHHLFGYLKIEATDIHYELVQYAQYADAVQVTFLPKGKRLKRILKEGYRPRIVILEGWNHPDTATIFKGNSLNSGTIQSKIAHLSKSGFEESDNEFNVFLEKYIESSQAKILADSRGFEPKENDV